MARRKKKGTDEPSEVAQAWRSPIVVRVLSAFAVLYLGSMWLDAAGSGVPSRNLPQTFTYFTQIARLFPSAAQMVIDYRVEGWLCDQGRWAEIDPRKDFPLDADDKENRFYRTAHFFRQTRTVMNALDQFLVDRNNARVDRGGDSPGRIGGVRILSLRIPIPPVGSHVDPYTRVPIASFSGDRKNWFWTKKSVRAQRCGKDIAPSTSNAPEDDEK